MTRKEAIERIYEVCELMNDHEYASMGHNAIYESMEQKCIREISFGDPAVFTVEEKEELFFMLGKEESTEIMSAL